MGRSGARDFDDLGVLLPVTSRNGGSRKLPGFDLWQSGRWCSIIGPSHCKAKGGYYD